MVRLGVVTVLLLIASAGSEAQAPAEADALRNRQVELERTLDALNRESTALIVNARALHCSASLRAEEARSLRRRFPGISVSEINTPAQFRTALEREQHRQRADLIRVLTRLRTIYRAQACTALGALRGDIAELRAHPDYPMLSLDQRMAVENLVTLGEDGDPCSPLVEQDIRRDDPMMDGNAMDVGMDDPLAVPPQCGEGRGDGSN